MECCIGELNLKQALVFLDDLIAFSPTLESKHVTTNENTIKDIYDEHLHLVVGNPPMENFPNATFVVSLAHHPKVLAGSFKEEDEFGGLPIITLFAPDESRNN